MAQETTCLAVPLGPELCHQLEILFLCPTNAQAFEDCGFVPAVERRDSMEYP